MYFGIHHVQLSCPPDAEFKLRQFYVDVIGLTEVDKPRRLAARGGCWFRGPGASSIELHLGVEHAFVAAKKAHPGIMWGDKLALDRLAKRLELAAFDVTWDDELHGVSMHVNDVMRRASLTDGMWRFYTHDPVGNRLEFLSPRGHTTGRD